MTRRRKKRKKTTSLMGALIIETLAVIAFVALFFQARAERQQDIAGETPVSAVAAWPSLLEETPFQGAVRNANRIDQPTDLGMEQNFVRNTDSFLRRLVNID